MQYHPDFYTGRFKHKDFSIGVTEFLLRKMGKVGAIGTAKTEATAEEATKLEDLANEEIKKIALDISNGKISYGGLPSENLLMGFYAMIKDTNSVMFSWAAEDFMTDPSSKIYKVPPMFMMALAKLRDNIRYELLPEYFSAFVPVPTGALKDFEGVPLSGLYISLRPGAYGEPEDYQEGLDKVGFSMKNGNTLSVAVISSTIAGQSVDEVLGDYMVYRMPIRNGESYSDTVERLRTDSFMKRGKDSPMIRVHTKREVNEYERAIFSFAVNFVSYVHSLEPDMSLFKPNAVRTSRESKKMEREYEVVDTAYPTVFVSWGYGKNRTYSMDSTWVDAHLVWQRCGPGFKDTKLIMRSGHERHFSNKSPEVLLGQENRPQ